MSTDQIFREQQRPLSLERQFSSEHIQRSKFKAKRKLGQLENKVYFFEGQLNPITLQNRALKQKLVELNRAVSSSSDLLRNLLPVQNNPTKKLKLQIASLQQISAMIKQDWLQMKQQIRCMKQQLKIKTITISQLEEKLRITIQNYDNIITDQKTKYENQIMLLRITVQTLEKKIIQIQRKSQQQKQQLMSCFTARLQEAENIKRQFQKFIHQANQKYSNYQRIAQRLRDEISHNLLEFEKSKQNLKQIYQNLMQSKLQQQAKQFQYLLKLKQQQKLKMIEQMNIVTQELKKKISEKNSEISHLSGINDRLKEEVGKAKDEAWAHKIQLDKCQKQLKQAQQKLYFEIQDKKQLKLKLTDNQRKMQQFEQNLSKVIEKYEKQLKEQKSKINSLQNKVREQKEQFQKKIQQSELKIVEIRRKLRENDQKFQQRLQQQKNRYDQMRKFYEQDKINLQKLLDEAEDRVKQKQKQISNIIKNNDALMKKMEDINQAKLRKLEMQNQRKLKMVMQQNEQKIKMLNRDYQLKLSELQISNNQYVRKLVADHMTKLQQQENRYKELQESSQRQIKQAHDSLDSYIASNKLLKNQLQQVTQNFKRASEDHKRFLQQLRKQNQKKLEMQKQKLLNEMQQQILLFKKTMDERQAQYKSKLSKMEQTLQKQINMLRQSNAIQSVEQKYLNIIAKMKDDLEQRIKSINQENERNLKKNLEQYHKQLNLLSQKLQFDISKLNQQLLEQKDAHKFDTMTRQQKIAYLVSKINEYRTQMNEKDNQIIQLQFQVDKKNKQLEQVDELVEIKVKKIKRQLEMEILQAKQQLKIQVSRMQNQYQAKVKKIQTQRIQFTKQLYDQFQAIKIKYEKEKNRLIRKYEELQKVFEQRPSRAQDLSKIKQLIQQKSKMDIQIKECKKKVKQANQIVKYLNLQLQNYKQTYDIFGPGTGEPLSPQRRYQTQTDSPSPIRSVYRRQNTLGSEQSQKVVGSLYREKEKRTIVESPDLQEFRIFPSLVRNVSVAVAQQDNQSQGTQKQPRSNLKRKEKAMFNNKFHQNEDKSQQLKNNASIFMGLINKQQKSPIELPSTNKGYSRRLSRKKTLTISYDKKLQIKDKTLQFQ